MPDMTRGWVSDDPSRGEVESRAAPNIRPSEPGEEVAAVLLEPVSAKQDTDFHTGAPKWNADGSEAKVAVASVRLAAPFRGSVAGTDARMWMRRETLDAFRAACAQFAQDEGRKIAPGDLIEQRCSHKSGSISHTEFRVTAPAAGSEPAARPSLGGSPRRTF